MPTLIFFKLRSLAHAAQVEEISACNAECLTTMPQVKSHFSPHIENDMLILMKYT